MRNLVHARSEEHTSELQSHVNLVCRLLLEKKKCYKRRHSNNHTGVSICCRGRTPRARALPSRPILLPLPHAPSSRPGDSLRFFFFNDAATPEISPLSLHGALPI